MSDPLFKAGHVFEGPDGQGYHLLADVLAGDPLSSSQFEAIGGAPPPVRGEQLPRWLEAKIEEVCAIWTPWGGTSTVRDKL